MPIRELTKAQEVFLEAIENEIDLRTKQSHEYTCFSDYSLDRAYENNLRTVACKLVALVLADEQPQEDSEGAQG